MFSWTCGIDIVWICHTSPASVKFKSEQMESLLGCDSFLCVLLYELMAAVWINGFVNGQEATGRVDSVSIYNRSNMPANQIYGRDSGKKENTDPLQLISRECKIVTVNALNNLFLRLLYKLVISILNINWIKI